MGRNRVGSILLCPLAVGVRVWCVGMWDRIVGGVPADYIEQKLRLEDRKLDLPFLSIYQILETQWKFPVELNTNLYLDFWIFLTWSTRVRPTWSSDPGR